MMTLLFEHDPHGIVISIVSILMVFAVLTALYLVYSIISKFITLSNKPLNRVVYHTNKLVSAPLPGIITLIKVRVGEKVMQGQSIAILEAMKMENEILSEHDGVVTSIDVKEGDFIQEGEIIITIGQ